MKLRLDLGAFDEAPFVPPLRACQADGLRFETLAGLGTTDENRRKLFELNRECSADIPGRGPFHAFDDYVARRIEAPQHDPAGIVVGLNGEQWVGMSAVSIWRDKGFAFAEMTGVVRSHRRRGLSMALKLLTIRFARAQGLRWLLTIHNAESAAPIGMNRRLGFVDADWSDPLFG